MLIVVDLNVLQGIAGAEQPVVVKLILILGLHDHFEPVTVKLKHKLEL